MHEIIEDFIIQNVVLKKMIKLPVYFAYISVNQRSLIVHKKERNLLSQLSVKFSNNIKYFNVMLRIALIYDPFAYVKESIVIVLETVNWKVSLDFH